MLIVMKYHLGFLKYEILHRQECPGFYIWGRGLTDTNLATILHIDLFLIFLLLPKTLQIRKDELKPTTIQRLPIQAIFENIIILFVVPPKFSSFSWDFQSSQENWKTMLMDNFGGVFLSMAYSSTFNGRISYHVKNGETCQPAKSEDAVILQVCGAINFSQPALYLWFQLFCLLLYIVRPGGF